VEKDGVLRWKGGKPNRVEDPESIREKRKEVKKTNDSYAKAIESGREKKTSELIHKQVGAITSGKKSGGESSRRLRRAEQGNWGLGEGTERCYFGNSDEKKEGTIEPGLTTRCQERGKTTTERVR